MAGVLIEFEAAFAAVMALLMFTIIRYVHIKYRADMRITHLTKRPYIIAMLLFTTAIIECTTYIYVTNVMAHDNFNKAKIIMFSNVVIKNLLQSITVVKFSLTLVFICTRAFESAILLAFINYQRPLRVEDLEVNKERYQAYERKIYKMYVMTCVIVCSPIVLFYIF